MERTSTKTGILITLALVGLSLSASGWAAVLLDESALIALDGGCRCKGEGQRCNLRKCSELGTGNCDTCQGISVHQICKVDTDDESRCWWLPSIELGCGFWVRGGNCENKGKPDETNYVCVGIAGRIDYDAPCSLQQRGGDPCAY